MRYHRSVGLGRIRNVIYVSDVSILWHAAPNTKFFFKQKVWGEEKFLMNILTDDSVCLYGSALVVIIIFLWHHGNERMYEIQLCRRWSIKSTY